jgi:hypothetical protein
MTEIVYPNQTVLLLLFGFCPLCKEFPHFWQKLTFSGTSVPHLEQNGIKSPFVFLLPVSVHPANPLGTQGLAGFAPLWNKFFPLTHCFTMGNAFSL